MSVFERYLSLWIALAMVAGIALGARMIAEGGETAAGRGTGVRARKTPPAAGFLELMKEFIPQPASWNFFVKAGTISKRSPTMP